MTLKPGTAVSIGECMVEFACRQDGSYGLSYGGDTFNTAAYLARLGTHAVSYVTALGEDPYSDGIVALAAANGIGTELVARVPARMPGLYVIETDPSGERTFWYWRDRSPARDTLQHIDLQMLADRLARAQLVYLSGITLSLYGAADLERLAELVATARRAGATLAMDSNYRPRGWLGRERGEICDIYERFWRLTDLALPSFDDEVTLWGDDSPVTTRARLERFGVREVVIKCGAGGVLVQGDDTPTPVPRTIEPLDTTAAGDSFNAGYLAARTHWRPAAAAAFGQRLAACVITERGAIVSDAVTAPFARELHQARHSAV